MTEIPQEPSLPQSDDYPQTTQPVSRRRPMVLAILGGVGCLLLTLIIVGAIFFFVKDVEKEELQLINDQLKAFRANDIDRAYSYCSLEFKKSTSRNDFMGLVEDFPILQSAKEFVPAEKSQKVGITTIFRGAIVGEDGSKLSAEYQLIRENKKLKVQFLKLSPAGIEIENQHQETTEERKPQIAPAPLVAPLPKPSLQIANLNVAKKKETESTKITVTFQVMNFVNDKSSGSARMHLVQDLKTVDPNGNIVPELSKESINELNESGEPEYKSGNFEYKLTIAPNLAAGKYQMVITVHDRIGGSAAATTAQFEIP